jgi:hypothetical protein
MLPFKGSKSLDRQHPRWCWLVIVFAILSITASLATRTGIPTVPHGITVQAQSSQAMRQHMDGDAFHWASPAPVLTVIEVPTFYPRFAPAGPPLPNLLFDVSLYNRPPPSC